MRVKLRPLKTAIPISVCNHRHDAVATFSHQTDTRIETSIYAAELYGFKNNVRLGAFISSDSGFTTGIREQEQSGLIRNDIYFPTNMWKNPTTGVIEMIPDYLSSTWTSEGANAFENAIAGNAKAARTPKHGQQMFNITNGRLGCDYINGVIGTNNQDELIGVIEWQQDWIIANTGRKSSAGSYRNGDDGGRFMFAPFFLGFRNSISPTLDQDAQTFYGLDSEGNALGYPYLTSYNRDTFLVTQCSGRWWDNWNTKGFDKQDSTDHFIEQLQKCITEKGWYKDFCHWHSARNNGTVETIDEFLQIFNTAKGGNFVWTCSMGEAYEYMFLREMVDYLNVVEKDEKVLVIADLTDEYKEILNRDIEQELPLDTINIPLSVKVDLTGTILAGKNIKSTFGKLISKGSNQYIVEVPFHHKDGFIAVELSEGENGYYNTATPTGTLNIVGNKLNVSLNHPCKMVLFEVVTGGNEYDSMPIERIQDYKSLHSFEITGGKDFRVGIINEFGMANLI